MLNVDAVNMAVIQDGSFRGLSRQTLRDPLQLEQTGWSDSRNKPESCRIIPIGDISPGIYCLLIAYEPFFGFGLCRKKLKFSFFVDNETGFEQ